MATSLSSEDPIDNFSCKICQEIPDNPVQCQRNEHYFCTRCITKHLKKSRACPVCKEKLTLQTLRPIPRVVADVLSQYHPEPCKYVDRGCEEKIKRQNLPLHYMVCGFAPVVCSNEGCGETVNRQDLASHEESCLFRKTKCENCKREMTRFDYEMHPCVLRKEMDEVKLCLVEMNSRLKAIQLKGVQGKPIEPLQDDLIPKVSSPVVQRQKSTNVDGQIVVVGGQWGEVEKSYEVFNWRTKSWALYDNALFYDHNNSFLFPYDNNIMICGGGVCRTKIESLDINTGSSSTTRVSLPSSQSGKGVLCGDHIITFGDSITKTLLKPPYSSEVVLKYDEGERWSGYGVQCVNGKVVLVGGNHYTTSKDHKKNEVMVYDPSTNEFTKLTPLPYELQDMATVAYKDNIIILGGEIPGICRKRINTAMMYNITSQQCKMLPHMLEVRSEAAAVIIGDTIVVMGGRGEKGDILNTVEYLVLGQNSWKKFPTPMHCAREDATAIHFKHK